MRIAPCNGAFRRGLSVLLFHCGAAKARRQSRKHDNLRCFFMDILDFIGNRDLLTADDSVGFFASRGFKKAVLSATECFDVSDGRGRYYPLIKSVVLSL